MIRIRLSLCAGLLALVAAGCQPPAPDTGTFRVRADAAAALNADAGWAGAPGETVTVTADAPFRIRFEAVGSEAVTASTRFRLQVRRNDGDWTDVEAHDFPYPEEASPRVSVVSTGAYAHGTATTDLLAGSSAPFRAGAGVDLAAESPAWPGTDAHGEWEWPIVIRRFADGAETNEAGDAFAFRMTDAEGQPVSTEAGVTLTVPPGHLGGTFVETPGRVGPWQASNGDLYFIMEPTESDNVLMMVKSTDGGTTWQEVDGANRPAADDLEGLGSDLFGDTVHILHQTSDHVWHHAFRTSDHPTQPDTWALTDESVASPGEPPVQVASLVARSDGSLVAAYGAPTTIHLRVRSPEGEWGVERPVEADADQVLSGPQAVRGADDVVHLAYTAMDGTAWYRRFLFDGTLSPREQVATGLGTTESDVGAIAPLAFVPETDAVVFVYRKADGHLWARRAVAGAPLAEPVRVSAQPVVQNAVDSDQVGADAITDGATVHVLFIDEGSRDIYHAYADSAGNWRAAAPVVEGVNAQWLRGHRLESGDGRAVLGFVFDAGSDGGAGMNRYAEVPLGDG